MTQRISAHQRLLEAASELFYRNGIAATGIDAIVKEAGVAKKSLYNNFASKQALVEAYLAERHKEWLALYDARMQGALTPKDAVLAVFLAYEDHAAQAYGHGFRGCGLLNAAAELPADSAERRVVRQHKEQVETLLRQHAEAYLDGRHQRAETVAHHLAFLLEGAMARAGLEGNGECLVQARAMAAQMLEAL